MKRGLFFEFLQISHRYTICIMQSLSYTHFMYTYNESGVGASTILLMVVESERGVGWLSVEAP